MAVKKDLTKDERVKKEISRVKRFYKELPKDILQVVDGLVVQAARHRVKLDDYWEDINTNGETEMFSQSPNTDPYERERPVVRHYFQTDKQYQAIMKQLGDYIPKKPQEPKDKDDGFESFVMSRD